jgi:hypothetical protein
MMQFRYIGDEQLQQWMQQRSSTQEARHLGRSTHKEGSGLERNTVVRKHQRGQGDGGGVVEDLNHAKEIASALIPC